MLPTRWEVGYLNSPLLSWQKIGEQFVSSVYQYETLVASLKKLIPSEGDLVKRLVKRPETQSCGKHRLLVNDYFSSNSILPYEWSE